MSDAEEPKRYGKCVVEREIGRGARAIVYLAEHEGLQIPVALKVMRKDNGIEEEQFAERFMREARLTAQLNHSNIVRVYDCGETEDSYYLILEYIEGDTCKDRLSQDGAFGWQTAVRIIRQVADGLGYANKKGIIHRDLKPENIMVDAEGNAHLADLGLAKQIVAEQASATVDGDVLGTPYYMSPEQVRQPGSVDFRADIYSLGATLYHMATGTVPFEANTPFEIMTKHLSTPLTPPEEIEPDLPPALSGIIMRMMAKEPQDRYQSYHELIRELNVLLGDETEGTGRDGAPAAGVEQAGEAGEAVFDAELAAAQVAEEPTVPREAHTAPPTVRAAALPVAMQNVQAKLLGILSLLACTFLLVCLYQLLLGTAGLPVALSVLVVLVAAWVAWGYALRHGGSVSPAEADSDPVLKRVLDALAGLGDRLSLRPPRVRATDCEEDVWSAYSFFSRRASLHVPLGWLREAGLNEKEMEAYLAQALGSVFSGDSDLRTLLAVPAGLLAGGRWLGERALKVFSPADSRVRLRFAQLFALAALVGACAVAAALFFVSFWAGAAALVFFGLLVLVSGFERYCRCAGDAFAARVMGSRPVAASMIVTSGLSGVERYGLVRECVGEFEADRWSGEMPPPDVRRGWLGSIAAHYAEIEYVPSTLETARKLFRTVPLAAERLNRLAGVPRGRATSVRIVDFARAVFGRLLGVRRARAMTVGELGATRLAAGLGAFAGLLVVGSTAALFLQESAYYPFFLVVTAVLGAALGVVLSWQASIEGLLAAKVGWKVTVAGVFLVCVSMLAFCLVGLRALAPFALQVPVYLPLVVLAAGGAAAAFARLTGVAGPGPAPEVAQVEGEAAAPVEPAAAQPAAGVAVGDEAAQEQASPEPGAVQPESAGAEPAEGEAPAGEAQPAVRPEDLPQPASVSAAAGAPEPAVEEPVPGDEEVPAEEEAGLESEIETALDLGPEEPAQSQALPEEREEPVAGAPESAKVTEHVDTEYGLDKWPPRQPEDAEVPATETPAAEAPAAEEPVAGPEAWEESEPTEEPSEPPQHEELSDEEAECGQVEEKDSGGQAGPPSESAQQEETPDGETEPEEA